MNSARDGHASLGATVCSHVGVGPQGVPKHLHSHNTLAASRPHVPSLSSTPPTLPCAPPGLYGCPVSALTPNSPYVLPALSLVSHSKTVKQPHNGSGALSLIMTSVYYRLHAPPHRQPIFPHGHACVCIFKQIDAQLVVQPHDVCAHASCRGVHVQG